MKMKTYNFKNDNDKEFHPRVVFEAQDGSGLEDLGLGDIMNIQANDYDKHDEGSVYDYINKNYILIGEAVKKYVKNVGKENIRDFGGIHVNLTETTGSKRDETGYDESKATGTLFNGGTNNGNITDKDIIDVLGIETSSGKKSEINDFIKQCRSLIEKGHDLMDIGFWDCYGINVEGKIIDKTKDLIVINGGAI